MGLISLCFGYLTLGAQPARRKLCWGERLAVELQDCRGKAQWWGRQGWLPAGYQSCLYPTGCIGSRSELSPWSITDGLRPESCALPLVNTHLWLSELSYPDSVGVGGPAPPLIYSCHIARGPYPAFCGAGTLLASSVSLRLPFPSRMNL